MIRPFQAEDGENCIGIIKDSFHGKKCFIVATGPSLAYKDLSFLKNEIIIALNLAPLTLDLFGIKPTFNIIADKFQYVNFKDVYKNLTYNTKVKKIIIASACETFPLELKDDETYFFPKKLSQDKANFSDDPIQDGFARGKTVAFDAIQLAYYLGFNEVYIIGMDMTVDHHWGKNGHCYEIHKNTNFPSLNFNNTDSYEIQRGLPGHPEYISLINDCMLLAKNKFEGNGKKIFNDIRSSLKIFEKRDIFKEFGKLKIVAFVPAKGTSSRVKGKNLKLLNNKPLFLHVLDTLLSCYGVDEVYLDSESDEVFDLAKGRLHKCLRRDTNLATNKTDGNQLLLNEASKIDANIYIQILPTSPFLSQDTIDRAIFSLITSKDKDSLFGVVKDNIYLWKKEGYPANYDPLNIPNSVDLEETIIETMGIYLIHKNILFKRKSRIGNFPILFSISLLESIDIDTNEDFEFAELISKGMEVLKNERY